jgi:hypothetical protein
MQTYGLLQEDMQTAVMAEVRKRKTMKQASKRHRLISANTVSTKFAYCIMWFPDKQTIIEIVVYSYFTSFMKRFISV